MNPTEAQSFHFFSRCRRMNPHGSTSRSLIILRIGTLMLPMSPALVTWTIQTEQTNLKAATPSKSFESSPMKSFYQAVDDFSWNFFLVRVLERIFLGLVMQIGFLILSTLFLIYFPICLNFCWSTTKLQNRC